MRRGFTLVEMVVVIAILAVVTHLAVRECAQMRDQKLVRVADVQLETIRDSVYAEGTDGEPGGFLADMGRLVTVTNGTLSELWSCPTGPKGSCRYRVLSAVRENFVKGMPAQHLNVMTNANVHVPTGWRGPYLRLPAGKTRLYDPWGNPVGTPDAAGYARIVLTNRTQAAAVAHFGPTAIRSDATERRVPLVPPGGATSTLKINVVSLSGEPTGEETWAWYGPCEGLITGACHGVSMRFTGLTPGVRVVRNVKKNQSYLVRVRPGDNIVQIEVP